MTLTDATAFPYGLRVLVVDEDPLWLKILEKMLRKCSYQVTTCGLASEALRILRERINEFDIVISEVNMTDMDGFKLLEVIGLEMDLPVIMMSIDGETSRVMKGVQLGACDYLLKPLRMKELRNIWQHVYMKKMHEVKDIEGNDRCDDLQIFRNGERDLFMKADSGTMRKRKDMDKDHAAQDSSDGVKVKKATVVWTVALHQKFVNAVNQIGFDKVGPKKILDLMNVPGLTIEDVASYLQAVQRSQVLFTETVHEDTGNDIYMDVKILERIVNGSEEPRHLDFALLHSITENFSEKKKIGSGGCGIVYKGILRNGVVAVKRLHSRQTIKDKMFHREVISLISVKHQNIVRFLGYCSFTKEHAIPFEGKTIMADIRERLLCFEYIRNGSLDKHLSDELRGLEWQTRYQIIIGICSGLHYLHKDKEIIHMDLKPGNILLDDLMVPKITDFGLSRPESDSIATTTRLISQGYTAPEYISGGRATSKSDIYSLGVIIIELVAGSRMKPNITKVIRRWNHRWTKSMKQSSLACQQVNKCLQLALRCIQDVPTERPDISDIIRELNGIDTTDDQTQIQISPYCFEDILGIEPLEIRVPFEDLKTPHSIELINDTDDYFAFVTKAKLERFCTEPDKGIVPPRSKRSVTVAMQAQVNVQTNVHYTEVITVLSTRVDGALSVDAMGVTSGEIFVDKEDKVVDEVNVMVVFGTPQLREE